jgi:hypothetical protein
MYKNNMEVYIPYVIGSTLTAFIGNIAYRYYSYDDIDNSENIKINDYDLLIETNNNKKLGVATFKHKADCIRKICLEECGINIPDNSSKKIRGKMLRYIKEYETIGHYQFVQNHKKKNFKSSME